MVTEEGYMKLALKVTEVSWQSKEIHTVVNELLGRGSTIFSKLHHWLRTSCIFTQGPDSLNKWQLPSGGSDFAKETTEAPKYKADSHPLSHR
ncbi:hypothetical protein CEXT_429511 [Caerostris extrusa]|uniref:Uncharacterized protein n=1 Tax=Caerostris extrusa TaxID=172846 RepID=A0AAV4XP00_CAEEX|nr:hypothetical protein CEXT_429511 [Caerostris extrusa]